MNARTQSEGEDPFELSRFVTAQESVFEVALQELRSGSKESHWMWFIFPQLAGLGSSAMAKKYAIRSLEEAHAYLNHAVLGPRMIDCCRALLSVNGKSAAEIMGSPDDVKLKSSMTLFSLVTETHPEFRKVLGKYFESQRDQRTLTLLDSRA